MKIEAMELKIAKFLRAGVLLAGILIAVGWLFALRGGMSSFETFRTYEQVPLQELVTVHYQQGHWGVLLSYVGLIVLIFLPLIRVFLTGILFIKQKDHLLALVAGLVLVFLIISFTFGIEL